MGTGGGVAEHLATYLREDLLDSLLGGDGLGRGGGAPQIPLGCCEGVEQGLLLLGSHFCGGQQHRAPHQGGAPDGSVATPPALTPEASLRLLRIQLSQGLVDACSGKIDFLPSPGQFSAAIALVACGMELGRPLKHSGGLLFGDAGIDQGGAMRRRARLAPVISGTMPKGGWQEFSRPESQQRPAAATGAPADPVPRAQQQVRVQRTKAGKKGKMVTAISGLAIPEVEAKALLKRLKARAGTGGTLKDGVIELQGDQVAVALEALEQEGFRPKQAGG